MLRPVMEADLLVLDDLGAEKTSEWVEETLNLIVNSRYSERRPTIFTSNYDDNAGQHRPRLAALPHRLPHALAAARDVRVPRTSTAATTASSPRNGGVDDLVTLWKMRSEARARPSLPSADGRSGARPLRNDREPSGATARPT